MNSFSRKTRICHVMEIEYKNRCLQFVTGRKIKVLILTVVACFCILCLFDGRIYSAEHLQHFNIANTKTLLYNLIQNPFEKHQAPEVKNHVGYLKVHKTGSTTIQNIFNRYVLHHNLTSVLPTNGNYLSNTNGNSKWYPILPPPGNRSFDMLFDHCTFNDNVFKTLLPEDTVYIASVRNPVTRFVSAFCYYRTFFVGQKNFYLNKVRGRESDLIHMFLQNIRHYDKYLLSETRNRMAGDFGYPVRYFNDLDLFNDYLQHVGQFFDFVLIAERFTESIVYMRRLLGWSVKDVIQIKVNSLSNSNKCKTKLSPAEVNVYRHHSPLDFILYDYFLFKFNETMSKQDGDFFEEVKYYSEVTKKVEEFCNSSNQTTIRIASSIWSNEFNVSVMDCKYFMMDEIEFLNVLKKRRKYLLSMYGKNKHSPLESLKGLNMTLFNKFRI